MEQTLSIIKPDAVKKGVIGKIISRFETNGLRIAAAKKMQLSRYDAGKFYEIHKERPFYNDLIDFALKKKPALIFIDNITCFINNNVQFKGNFNKEFLNIFNQIEKNEGIILIATDNYPWNLETTFLSKFQKKINIPLPDFEAKKQILKLNMKNIPNTLTEEQIEDIIKKQIF